MAISLLGAGALAAGAAGAARLGSNIYGATQLFTQDDEDRLRELERKKALHQLGMSDQERALAEQQMFQPIAASEREGRSDLMRQMSIADVGASQAARSAATFEEASTQARAQAAQALARQEEIRRQQDLNEIAQLREQEKARKAAMGQAFAGGVESGAQLFTSTLKAQQDAANQEAILQQLKAQEIARQESQAYMSDATNRQLEMLFKMSEG